jgi:hypothetical protein
MTAVIEIIEDAVLVTAHSCSCYLQVKCSGGRSNGAGASANARVRLLV